MATYRLGTSLGDSKEDVAVGAGAALAADSVELTYDEAVITTQHDLVACVERLMRRVKEAGRLP